MRGLGTDHLISGPTRGLKKTASDGAHTHTDRHTDKHGDSMTESVQWGRFIEKLSLGDLISLPHKPILPSKTNILRYLPIMPLVPGYPCSVPGYHWSVPSSPGSVPACPESVPGCP